jgi:hypothetical protein
MTLQRISAGTEMSSERERIAYLREHLFYEVLMLRFTLRRLDMDQTQLLWNALYESFGVHARNLHDFLRRNKGDSRNFRARDFTIGDFIAKKRNCIDGLMEKMRQQILHLGKRRTASKEKKIDLDDVKNIATWIEQGLMQFSRELKEPYKSNWEPDKADPEKNVTYMLTGQHSQSSHSVSTLKSRSDGTLLNQPSSFAEPTREP